MGNPSKYRARMDQTKSRDGIRTHKKRERACPDLRMMDIEDGVYRIRFFPPHPERAEEGFLHLIFHQIEPTEDCPKKQYIKVLAKQCYDDPSAHGYMSDLLDQIEEKVQPKFHELSGALQNYIDLLNEKERFIIPTLFWADEKWVKSDPVGPDNKVYDNRKLTPNDNTPTPRGFCWELTTQGALIKRILELLDMYPLITDPDRGHCLRFSKQNNTYSIDPEPTPSVWPMSALKFRKEDYPTIDSWLKSYRRSDTEAYNAIQRSWGGPELAALGVDLRPRDQRTQPMMGGMQPMAFPGQQQAPPQLWAPPQQQQQVWTPPQQPAFGNFGAPVQQPQPAWGQPAPAAPGAWNPPPAQPQVQQPPPQPNWNAQPPAQQWGPPPQPAPLQFQPQQPQQQPPQQPGFPAFGFNR